MKIVFKSLPIMVLVVALACNLNAQSKKEIRHVCKQYKKRGWVADLTLGSCESQNKALSKLRTDNERLIAEGESERWIISTTEESSENKTIALSKARNTARQQLAINMGSALKGKIESGEAFTNMTGEDITDELTESTGAFDEIFMNELRRNRVVTRFEKQIGDKWNIQITVVMDMDEFMNKINKLKKSELKKRIEDVRHKMENAP